MKFSLNYRQKKALKIWVPVVLAIIALAFLLFKKVPAFSAWLVKSFPKLAKAFGLPADVSTGLSGGTSRPLTGGINKPEKPLVSTIRRPPLVGASGNTRNDSGSFSAGSLPSHLGPSNYKPDREITSVLN